MNPYSLDPDMVTRINQAPSIISLLINNFLAFGKQPFVSATGETVEVYLFPAQRVISETLVVIVIVMMPIMLLVKPFSACCCPIAANMPEYANDHAEEHEASNPNGVAEEERLAMINTN